MRSSLITVVAILTLGSACQAQDATSAEQRPESSLESVTPDADGCLHCLHERLGNCLSKNFNVIRFSYFEPSIRAYFDTGSDDAGEIDLFENGALMPSLDLVGLQLLNTANANITDEGAVKSGALLFGLQFNLGIGAPAGASADGTKGDSRAPVVMGSAGFLALLKASNEFDVGAEFGYAHGWSTDESFDDNNDGALFVGVKIRAKLP